MHLPTLRPMREANKSCWVFRFLVLTEHFLCRSAVVASSYALLGWACLNQWLSWRRGGVSEKNWQVFETKYKMAPSFQLVWALKVNVVARGLWNLAFIFRFLMFWSNISLVFVPISHCVVIWRSTQVHGGEPLAVLRVVHHLGHRVTTTSLVLEQRGRH